MLSGEEEEEEEKSVHLVFPRVKGLCWKDEVEEAPPLWRINGGSH